MRPQKHNAEDLRGALNYDPETGLLTWRHREERSAAWNGKHAGKRAGTVDKVYGYRVVSIDRKNYKEHRVIWAIMTGEWPVGETDHRNGLRADNRWDNLRPATKAQNQQNRGARKNSASGLMGAHKTRNGRWQSEIRIDGKRIHLGTFDTPDAAAEVYREAKKKHHPFNPEQRI